MEDEADCLVTDHDAVVVADGLVQLGGAAASAQHYDVHPLKVAVRPTLALEHVVLPCHHNEISQTISNTPNHASFQCSCSHLQKAQMADLQSSPEQTVLLHKTLCTALTPRVKPPGLHLQEAHWTQLLVPGSGTGSPAPCSVLPPSCGHVQRSLVW